ncbi:MAG TPA: glycosyl hydrolase family 18 protein [Fimbriimonas sp.]|nr:glycosyl hydrolase family 18 protein [Fimbriimonas sp.]
MAQAQKLVVAYVPNWNDVDTLMGKVDFSKLTHIDVAFENPIDDEGNLSFNPKDAAVVEKSHAKGVKVLISIGGGGAAENKTLQARYFALQSDEKRAGFVAKLAAFVNDHNFDGLDVDLEGPSIGKDYGPFVSDLSKALQANGKLITAAVSQGYGGDKIPNSVLDQFSFVNVMAYDGTGPWNKDRPGQHSSMEYTKANVDYWVGRGLPKSKTVVGVPFYGYGFGDAYRNGDYSFSEIVTTFPGAENQDQIGSTIWYNGIPTIKAKAKYVVDEGLGGVMIWSLDADAPAPKSLLDAIWDGLHS